MRSSLGTILVISFTVPAVAAEKGIVDTATANGLKTFVTAIKAADLVETLEGNGSFTVFAPTDEAFAKLPAATLKALLKPEKKEDLQAILTYHLVAGRSMAADVARLDGKTVHTVQGAPLRVSVAGGAVRIGNATVIKPDIATSHGVIHVIDTVLLPPMGTQSEPVKTSAIQPKPADGDAPLAEGFPGATNPGTVEVKKYPAYRSAVARSNKAGVSSGNMLFFSLFNHIQKNRIEMTAPVINTYKTPRMIETPGATGDVTMEFVYRSLDEGKTGPDGATVEVLDHPAQHFVCLGFQGGNLSNDQMREALATLRHWLVEHKGDWVEDGPPRRLGYHGPMTPPEQRLWELQIPVKSAR